MSTLFWRQQQMLGHAAKLPSREPDAGAPAKERIYAFVSEQILRGVFPGGSFIEEEYISKIMQVSRTPVREAFHRLEADRYIDLLPRKGALVREVTAVELADLYEARRMVEGYAVSKICRERRSIPAKMGELVKAMGAMTEDLDIYEHVLLDREFHGTIVAVAGNAVMVEMYRGLRSRQRRVAMRALSVNPDRIAKILAEHSELHEALQRHDEARALAVLNQHLTLQIDVLSKLSP